MFTPWELVWPQLPSIALCCWWCQSQNCRGPDQVGIIRLRNECHTSNFILFSRDYQCPFNKMRLTLCSSSIWKLSVSIILTTKGSGVLSTLRSNHVLLAESLDCTGMCAFVWAHVSMSLKVYREWIWKRKSSMDLTILPRNNNVEIIPYNLVLNCRIPVIKYLNIMRPKF